MQKYAKKICRICATGIICKKNSKYAKYAKKNFKICKSQKYAKHAPGTLGMDRRRERRCQCGGSRAPAGFNLKFRVGAQAAGHGALIETSLTRDGVAAQSPAYRGLNGSH